MNAGEQSNGGFELVMPFVAVRSVGGPYDDLAYAAGWELGALDVMLRHGDNPGPQFPIRVCNGAQAELVAMRNGYSSTLIPYDDDWSLLTVHREPRGEDVIPGW